MPLYRIIGINNAEQTFQSTILTKYNPVQRPDCIPAHTYKILIASRVVIASLNLRFTDHDRMTFYDNLATLLKNSFTLLDSLLVMIEEMESIKLKALAQTLHLYIDNGYSLHLADTLGFFDDISRESLQCAKATGSLAQNIQKLADYYRDKIHTQNEFKKALRYPLIIFVAIICLVFVLSSLVIPNISHFIPDENKGLAWITFQAFTQNSELFFSCLIIFTISTVIGKEYWLRLPIFSRLQLVKFWQTLSFCLDHNIPMIESLNIAKDSLDPFLIKSLNNIIKHIKDGKSISDSFQYLPYQSKIAMMILKISEPSGDLISGVRKITQIEKNFKKKLINKIIFWTQPILIFIIGTVLLWILFATIIPLYDSLATIQT